MTSLPLLLPLLFFSACPHSDDVYATVTHFSAVTTAHAAADAAVKKQIAIYRRDTAVAASRQKARRIAAALDDRQLAAQVIIAGIDGRGHLPPHMKTLLAECPAGGIILFRYNLDTHYDAIQNLIGETAAFIASDNGIPPFVAIDHEGGAVNRFRAGVADLPPAASYWELARNSSTGNAIARINADSFVAGKAMKALGVTMNLAPVAEYLNDDNREFLKDRSYGPDPDFTAEAAAAFIAGMEQAGILCVAKHFPGSAGPDPHRFPSVLNGDRAALNERVFPIGALIRSGRAHALMVSHTLVPAWDGEIASLSPPVMGAWLRRELGFTGIIISDDFSMAAAGSPALGDSPEAAALRSLAAGADMVLVWPPDLRQTHRAIVAALIDGRLSRERVRNAAGRIIYEKMKGE